jgi:RNA polymerase sigma factor (sigma-70 family)
LSMQEAFLKTIDENQGIIFRVCKMYRDTKQDQEDLFQEIVFQLWKAFPSFRRESKPSTWMYRIAINTAIAIYRKKRIIESNLDGIPEASHPFDKNERSENEERMFEALRKLNNAEKAIISLFLEDYSYKEIAEITGFTENNVGVQLNRIKNKLKTILNG